MAFRVLPLPPHYDPAQVGRVWRVPYEERSLEDTAPHFAIFRAALDLHQAMAALRDSL